MRIFKNSIVVALVLFLLVHTACTLLFVLPGNFVPASLKEKSRSYISPLFEQGWALFAPVPEVNKKVFVSRLQGNGQWSRWEAPFDEYLCMHQSNRMSASAKVVLSLSSALHYLYHENEILLKEKRNISGDSSSGYFIVLKKAVKNKLMWQYKENKNVRILIVYTVANCNKNQTYSIYYPEAEK